MLLAFAPRGIFLLTTSASQNVADMLDYFDFCRNNFQFTPYLRAHLMQLAMAIGIKRVEAAVGEGEDDGTETSEEITLLAL